jgi:TOMM system kinase/cyclase fusion protein
MPLQNDKISQQFDSSAYQLLKKIGEGGFGHVYLAKQINTGQSVAIKFLSISSDFDDNKRQRYVERFERETLLGSRLQHPNIVRLLGKGESGDLLFAVFEYVEGITLKQRLTQSGALSANDATDVMTQVLDALAHAHQQGVVHRDIKPANIMLTESAAKLHIKVLDFGIGTLVNEARVQDYKSITLTQETLGTPSYSSPEQLRGEPATVKTDLYVWGLVFIECLTGKPAMSGSNLASIFHKQLSQENVALPSAIVGHPLAALLRRVLQKKVHLRSVNATDLYHDIQQINVANLVGELHADNQTNSNISVAIDNDATLIHDNPVFNSTHTERKQLTVMAVRLNVNVIAGKEVNHEVIDTLHRDQRNQCLDTAIRYGAFHVGTLGDTQLFYYGYPAASDNDARLCARSALDLVSDLNKRNALLKINQGIQFDIKIGVHTGLLTCYADATPEGDTANIALQLVRLAGSDQILCSDSSQKILQSYLEFNPVSHQQLGVSSTSTALFNLMAERQVEAFGFLRAAQNNHLFIGREQEISTLFALQSQDSHFKMAHVVGEAGIGKSRLTFEFRNQSNQYTHFMGQCLPEHINNALYPIFNILKYKYALSSLSESDAIEKLSTEIETLADINLMDILPILSAWLGYSLTGDMAPSALSPDCQKQLLFKTLNGLLNKSDNGQANLIIFEDMHWADPTSLEFINSFSDSNSFTDSHNLFISTSRLPLPELLASEKHQSIALDKLTEQDSKNFINNLFDKQNVASQLMDAVVSRTDGIPLFIEELVDMLKQKGLVQHINGMTDFIDSEKIEQLPTSLRDSLQQKLDSLVYSKETAQLAATIGREFDYDLLVASSNRSEAQLQTDLDELVSADVILQKRCVSGDSYIFKHALVRDAAYESVSSAHRIRLHSNIADTLRGQTRSHPILIAEHLNCAQRYDEAASLGLSIAQKTLAQSLSQNAFDIANNAIEWNEKRNNSSDKYEVLLNLLSVTLPAIMTVEGMGSEGVGNEISRCEIALSQLTKSTEKLSKKQEELEKTSKCALAGFYNMRSMRTKARLLTEELVEQAIVTKDIEFEIAIRCHLGQNYYMEGSYQKAKEVLETAINLYDPFVHSGLAIKYSIEPESFSRMTLSLALWKLGFADQAVQMVNSAYQRATDLGHLGSVGMANIYRALVAYFVNDTTAIKAIVQENGLLCEQHPDMAFTALFLNCLDEWTKHETTHTEQFIAQRRSVNELYAMTFYGATLAESKIEQGNISEALVMLNEDINWCNKTGETIALSTLYRIQAKAYLASDKQDTSSALLSLKKSINIAREQGSIALQLDALVDLCNIEQQDNKKINFASLDGLVKQFTEGFETKKYLQAKALLVNI